MVEGKRKTQPNLRKDSRLAGDGTGAVVTTTGMTGRTFNACANYSSSDIFGIVESVKSDRS